VARFLKVKIGSRGGQWGLRDCKHAGKTVRV
jgi:hypothetical protein